MTRRPGGPAGRFVEAVWWARGSLRVESERVAPTGSTVLGIVLGPPIEQTPRNGRGETHRGATGFLIGPHDEPIVNRPSGETWCVGIVTTPFGCRAALGIDPQPLRGRVVGAEAWAPFGEVREALRAAADPGSALEVVEGVLDLGALAVPGVDRVEQAVELLTEDPAQPIGDLAERLGVSHEHLDREFARIVGLGPRTLARILRMRALLHSIDVFGTVAWTDRAAELGWFDQAHLIRDFRKLTGMSPSAYVAAYRAVYAPGEDEPGFAPDVPARGQFRPIPRPTGGHSVRS
ncbi:helix-turn-helix domain-containing protein [Lysobacter korlensis]|uniref:Helix-turn-helix domain-containing protein n=1 Tax=Lysobacter korlensis TaxID=553636 RepID=A0ABV6RNS6_9GAMM